MWPSRPGAARPRVLLGEDHLCSSDAPAPAVLGGQPRPIQPACAELALPGPPRLDRPRARGRARRAAQRRELAAQVLPEPVAHLGAERLVVGGEAKVHSHQHTKRLLVSPFRCSLSGYSTAKEQRNGDVGGKRPRWPPRADTLPRCASSSSPTSSPTTRRRSAAAGSATRSTRCAGAGSRSTSSASRPAAASTSPRPGGCGRCCARERFDLVHAHYGLPGWCARLAGARPLLVTFHGTDVRHGVVGPLSRRLAWRVDLVAAVSRALFDDGGRPPRPARRPRLRGPALRPRPRPLRPDPPRRGARARSASTPTAATSSSPPTRPGPRSATTAPPSSPPPAAPSCSPAARSSPSGCRSGSTPPTPSSSPPTTRASGWPRSRRWPATCRSSRPRSAIAPYALAGIEGCLCAPFDAAAWARRRAPPPRRRRPSRRRRGAGRLALGGARWPSA